MAKKSKTQRAKASAARQARKAESEQVVDASAEKAGDEKPASEDEPKRSLLKRSTRDEDEKKPEPAKKAEKKVEEKPKKQRFKFFREVKAELRRVTWPTRSDVLRWSGVVVVALLFFGVFVAVLDNLIITPVLIAISGIGA